MEERRQRRGVPFAILSLLSAFLLTVPVWASQGPAAPGDPAALSGAAEHPAD